MLFVEYVSSSDYVPFEKCMDRYSEKTREVRFEIRTVLKRPSTPLQTIESLAGMSPYPFFRYLLSLRQNLGRFHSSCLRFQRNGSFCQDWRIG